MKENDPNYLNYFFIVFVIKASRLKANIYKIHYKMLTKSQLWSEIKSLGNPQSLKWTASASVMNESIQSIYL